MPSRSCIFSVKLDLAFMGLVLHEADNRLQALREVRRVARLGAAVLEWPFRQEEHGPPPVRRDQDRA